MRLLVTIMNQLGVTMILVLTQDVMTPLLVTMMNQLDVMMILVLTQDVPIPQQVTSIQLRIVMTGHVYLHLAP